ncbi:hypothetical protein SDJN03_20520, partial [Cucurbita argyrosperma subsp. sororia]
MEKNYLNWAQALGTAWCFMLLLGLLCCCLSTKPRHHGDTSASNSSCTCDGGYAAMSCICFRGPKEEKNSNQAHGDNGARKFRPPRGYSGGTAAAASTPGNGNLTVLTDHDGGVVLASTFGFAVAAAAVVDAGEHGGECGGAGGCGGGGCGGG